MRIVDGMIAGINRIQIDLCGLLKCGYGCRRATRRTLPAPRAARPTASPTSSTKYGFAPATVDVPPRLPVPNSPPPRRSHARCRMRPRTAPGQPGSARRPIPHGVTVRTTLAVASRGRVVVVRRPGRRRVIQPGDRDVLHRRAPGGQRTETVGPPVRGRRAVPGVDDRMPPPHPRRESARPASSPHSRYARIDLVPTRVRRSGAASVPRRRAVTG